jgi:hypothetical protein
MPMCRTLFKHIFHYSYRLGLMLLMYIIFFQVIQFLLIYFVEDLGWEL